MPYNGSGTFVRLYSWVTDATNGVDISAPEMDNEMNGMAVALSDCLTRDGQSTWLANQPTAGFKLTGLGNGSASGDSVNFGQMQAALITGAPFRKNWLLNGAMQIAQRVGALGGLGVAASRGYCLDRWMVQASVAGSNASATQITGIGLSPFQFATRVQRTNGNANTGAIQFAQSLETLDSYPMQGLTVTLSFWARAGANYSPTSNFLNASVFTGTGTDQNVLTAGYTGSAQPISQNAALTTAWQRFQYSAALSGTETEVAAVFTMTPVGTAGANDYFDVTGVQLEVGSVATDYDHQPFGLMLTRCERYYEKSFALATAPATNAGGVGFLSMVAVRAGAVGQGGYQGVYRTRKRAVPTFTFYNPSAANNQAFDEGAAASCSSTTALTNSDNGFAMSFIGAAGTAVGNQIAVHWSADADL
jgi:hypothetical protein